MADVQTSSALVELTRARLREFTREPEALFWVFVFPILMAFALGIAFRSGDEAPVIVGVETRQGAESLLAALDGIQGVRVEPVPPERAEAMLRGGTVHVIVVPGRPPVYRFDPTRTESRLARLVLDDALQRAAGRSDRWDPVEERTVVRGSRYIDWLIPGLLGFNIMSTGVWSVAFSIVQARSRRILKQFIATPMRRRDFLLAQMLARIAFLGVEVAALVSFGWLVFDVPVRGSVGLLAGLALIGSLACSGIGLLAASRVRTVEAISGLVNLLLLPMWVLSGVFFASSNFPPAMQPFIQVLPLTALNDALRDVMLEGATWSQIAPDIGVMAAWGLASFSLALRLFQWR